MERGAGPITHGADISVHCEKYHAMLVNVGGTIEHGSTRINHNRNHAELYDVNFIHFKLFFFLVKI